MTVTVFYNANIVVKDDVIAGWVAFEGGRILEVGSGQPPQTGGYDLAGDFLLPGLVELHSDHLEAHVVPRPKVRWHPLAAVIAYDAQMAASGITTLFDSLRVGSDIDSRSLGAEVLGLASTIALAAQDGLLRSDHHLHLRCEVCTPDVLENARELMSGHTVGMISLMDHTPGSRQFRNVETWKTYYGGKSGLSSTALDALIDERLALHAINHDPQRTALVALAQANGVVLASHDDTTIGHVELSITDKVSIAEFPTTMDAASASHAAGIQVLMGAPNVVRGGSHSGNVSAELLAREGLLDILSSDYVPSSLLIGAFELANRIKTLSLADAIRTISLNPARATGLHDRGEIRAGLRADLIRVRLHGSDQLPIVREAYRDGNRTI
jgi:alpha-D-ribose 1-methylphosphonate 5-triphosphate diphosphatase